jgi:hypothetical protein
MARFKVGDRVERVGALVPDLHENWPRCGCHSSSAAFRRLH